MRAQPPVCAKPASAARVWHVVQVAPPRNLGAAMDPALLSRVSAVGRLGVGAGLVARPRLVASAWVGDDAGRASSQVLARALGIRDLVIGAGTLGSTGDEQQRWLTAALVADATDLAVTLGAGSALPLRGRVLVSLAAGAGVAMGAAALAGRRRA
jgi:hypothetical protein